MSLNFFGESHGKNARDQHFSSISKILEQASFKKRLHCSDEIVQVVREIQDTINITRNDAG